MAGCLTQKEVRKSGRLRGRTDGGLAAHRCWCSTVLAGAILLVTYHAKAITLRDGLGQFETGAIQPHRCAADRKIGSRHEISRFQILPSVWRAYTSSRQYDNPEVAWTVATRILRDRVAWFERSAGRPCDYLDLYLMWNAPGDYARQQFNRNRVSRTVLERAQRFANLMEAEESEGVRMALRMD